MTISNGMNKKKLFQTLAHLIFFILIVNFLAHKFYWYSSIWHFDILMHFLGGLWLGLASIWLFSRQKDFFNLSFGFVLKIILMVFLAGILWELFEVFFYNYIARNSFDALDTVSDICFDLAGGIFAIFYFLKIIKFAKKDAI